MSQNLLRKLLTGNDQSVISYLRGYIGLSAGSGTGYTVVGTYSLLPDATANSGKIYVVTASQGSKYIPGWLGGADFYGKGFYISDGVVWNYLGDMPYQATQTQVNAGTDNSTFVTPLTLATYIGQKNISLSNVGNGDVTATELSYLKGVTSSIQTQINSLSSGNYVPASRNSYTSSQTLLANSFNEFDTTGGAVVATLPALTSNVEPITVRWKAGAGSLTVATSGSEAINGVNSQTVLFTVLGQSLTFQPTTTGWVLI